MRHEENPSQVGRADLAISVLLPILCDIARHSSNRAGALVILSLFTGNARQLRE